MCSELLTPEGLIGVCMCVCVCACDVLRVRKMSRATENVAKSVLLGVVKTAGFFSGSLIRSKVGQKIFTLMPGEVALVSLDAFSEPLYSC